MRPRRSGRAGTGVTAGSALVTYWRSALLAVGLGALGLGALTTIAALGDSSAARTILRGTHLPNIEAALAWTPAAVTPDGLRSRAVGGLFDLLLATGWATLLVAGIALITLAVARSNARASTVRIHRAVGAPKRTLRAALALEGVALAAATIAVAIGLTAMGVTVAVGGWSGTLSGSPALPIVPFAIVAVVVIALALLPLDHMRGHRLVQRDDAPVPLIIPAFQLGLSFSVLLAAAVLLERGVTLAPATSADASAEARVIYQLDMSGVNATERAKRYLDTLQRLTHEPAVHSAGLANQGNLVGLGTVDAITTDCGECAWGGIIVRWHTVNTTHRFVTADSFHAASGARLIAGRAFTLADAADAPRVAIVNRHLALRHFFRGEAIGRPLYAADDWRHERPYTVVGIVDDRRPIGLGGGATPYETVYLSALQHPPANAELAMTLAGGAPPAGDIGALLARTLDLPLAAIRAVPATSLLAREGDPLRWFGIAFGLCGLLLLALATTGTATSLGLWVRSILPDLAIRRAIGAPKRRVLAAVGLRAIGVGTAGLGAGAMIFLIVVSDSIAAIVPNTPSPDAHMIWALATIFATAAIGGALIPAWRALRRPIAALLDARP